MAADAWVKITYNVKTDDFAPLETNLKPERVDEVLGEWLRGQLGQGKDDSPLIEREQYRIELDLDLSTDTFTTRSDTGNKGLTCGLVMHLMKTRKAQKA